MDKADIHIAVCIVGYRNSADVMNCLRALERSSWPAFDVVICENGGGSSVAELRASAPKRLAGGQPVRILDAGSNLGFAGGVNRCLSLTPSADAWWVLNPDTEPEPQALENLVRRLEMGNCAAVGGVLRAPDGRVQAFGGRWRSWSARAESLGMGSTAEPDSVLVERTQTYLNGASMLIGRRFLEAAGPMREDYFLYCEEVEWFVRARTLGLRLGFAPGADVLHRQGSATGSVADRCLRPRLPVYLDERNRMLLTRDHFLRRLPVAALLSLLRIVVGNARRGAWKQLTYGLQGWLAGLVGERGAPPWADGPVRRESTAAAIPPAPGFRSPVSEPAGHG